MRTRKNNNIIRISGYRVRFLEPRTQAHQWARVKKEVETLMPIYNLAAQEPFFLDDALKGYEPLDLTTMALRDGELLLCRYEGDDTPVGVVMISEILHQRKAKIDAYALPQFREDFRGRAKMVELIGEVIEYCFKPFPEGLGLQKLKAEVCADNLASLKACRALGFHWIGTSSLDALFNGEPRDTVLLELLNPEFFTNAISQISSGTDLQPSTELHNTADPVSTGSDRRNGDNEGSGENGSDAPELVTARRVVKSTRPSRPRKVRK